MRRTGWWNVAVAATLTLVAALVALADWSSGWQLAGAYSVIVVLAVAWGALGWRALNNDRLVLPIQIIMIAGTIVGTAFVPNIATLQCIAYPIIWALGGTTRRAVLMSVSLASGVAAGLFVSTGMSTDALVQAIAIQTVSLALGIGLGLWLSVEFRASGENARLLAELRSAQSALAEANREAGVTSERERLAREIHDTIAQSLTSLVMLAQRGQAEATMLPTPSGSAKVAEQLGLMEDIARDALTETRALVAASAPVSVDGGLAEALSRLIARFTRETGLSITTEFSGLDGLDRPTEVVVLRCTQEALANIRKHARASTVQVSAHGTDTLVTLRIRDDGIGFDTAADTAAGTDLPGGAVETGFGLDGMRQRVALVGGRLTLRAGRMPAVSAVDQPLGCETGTAAGTVRRAADQDRAPGTELEVVLPRLGDVVTSPHPAQEGTTP
jgi:signal transduction histidine kinase